MNWIDPKVISPKLGHVYLILFKSHNNLFVSMATVSFNRIYNEETEEYENGKMGWNSLYAPTHIRAFNINTIMNRNRYLREDIRNLYPIEGALAYISIYEIDYPIELIKLKCECEKIKDE